MQLEFAKMTREIYSVILKDLGGYGGFPFYAAMILLFVLLRDFEFVYRLIVSLVAVSASVAILRLAYFKPRPGQKKKSYSIFYERIDNSSFPSVHTARAVMISIALFTKAPVLLPLLVLMMIIVCASRLHFKRHYLVDVVAGLVIGLILGLVFF